MSLSLHGLAQLETANFLWYPLTPPLFYDDCVPGHLIRVCALRFPGICPGANGARFTPGVVGIASSNREEPPTLASSGLDWHAILLVWPGLEFLVLLVVVVVGSGP